MTTDVTTDAEPAATQGAHALVVENLTKEYKTYSSSLARALAPFRRTDTGGRFRALDNVSLALDHGDVVAILGRNGSGKSTLAKIVAGVTTPTSGRVEVNGRISAMLELTSGFDSQLSGIENVYLRALALGIPRAEADDRLDDIVAFADIGEHIKHPVRTYSSGMKARLGFAVSVNVDPDILIVDEVLSVGDDIFRLKCIDRMGKIREAGKTILFVSHSLGMVKSFCTKAIWIHKGVLQADGDIGPTVQLYEEFLKGERASARKELRDGAAADVAVERGDIVAVSGARLVTADGQPCREFEHGEDICLELDYTVKMPIPRLSFTFWIRNSEDVEVFASDRQSDRFVIDASLGTHHLRLRLVSPPLLGGGYKLSGELWNNASGFYVNHSRDRVFSVTQGSFVGTGIAAIASELTND